MKTTISEWRPRPGLGILAALALGLPLACVPGKTAPLEVDLPPVQAPPPDPGDPMEVRLAEPRADDLADLIRTLGVELQNWKYDGPECVVRLWLELKDDRVPGLPDIIAEGEFDLAGPDGRVVFALVPPFGAEAPPVAYIGTEAWNDKNLKRHELPSLWFGSTEARVTSTSIREEPFSIEEAGPRTLFEIHSDRTDVGETGRAQADRIALTLKMRVQAAEVPITGP